MNGVRKLKGGGLLEQEEWGTWKKYRGNSGKWILDRKTVHLFVLIYTTWSKLITASTTHAKYDIAWNEYQ